MILDKILILINRLKRLKVNIPNDKLLLTDIYNLSRNLLTFDRATYITPNRTRKCLFELMEGDLTFLSIRVHSNLRKPKLPLKWRMPPVLPDKLQCDAVDIIDTIITLISARP